MRQYSCKRHQHRTNTDGAGSFPSQFPIKILFGVFFGYISKEIAVTSLAAVVKLILDEKETAMNEVVVIGYGIQEKVDLTGAGFNKQKDFANKPFTSPDQILTGRLAGVNVTNRSEIRCSH
jgi:iron complex outermembrane receptor protein